MGVECLLTLGVNRVQRVNQGQAEVREVLFRCVWNVAQLKQVLLLIGQLQLFRLFRRRFLHLIQELDNLLHVHVDVRVRVKAHVTSSCLLPLCEQFETDVRSHLEHPSTVLLNVLFALQLLQD